MTQSILSRRAAVAAAVGAVFAGVGGSALAASNLNSYTMVGAGASSVQNTVTVIVLEKYCSHSSSTPSLYGTGTSSLAAGGAPGDTTVRIQCAQNASSGLSNPIDISYDTSGGAWKAFTASNPALLTGGAQTTANANPVVSVNTSTNCVANPTQPVSAVILGNTISINYYYNCAPYTLNPTAYPSTDQVTFGLAGDPQLYEDTTNNQPLVNNSWNTAPANIFTGSGGTASFSTNYENELVISNGTAYNGYQFPVQVFGVVFGLAASPALYKALQTDQINNSVLPSTCQVSGTPVVSAACAPSVSKAAYRSIVGQFHGSLNGNANHLFITNPGVTGINLELVRRDQGSDAQSSSNAYFLGDGCNSTVESNASPLLPVSGSSWITYLPTTSAAVKELNSPTLHTYAIGVVSTEKDNGKNLTGGAGFLKIGGVYPSPANAAAGLYDYVTEENLHFNANPPNLVDATQFATDLINVDSTLSAWAYSGTGIVQINSSWSEQGGSIVDGSGNPANPTAAFSNGGLQCQGWADYL